VFAEIEISNLGLRAGGTNLVGRHYCRQQ